MFTVKTDHPIATYSRDHTHPGGTMRDNSRWRPFNEKLYNKFSQKPLFIMDLGCSGGGFVKDCIDDSHNALGLEGSDYSLIRKRAEWGTIPQNLFTADITEPYQVYFNDSPSLFDCITAWEVMEHIEEGRLVGFCENIKRHLAPSGIFVASVSRQRGEHHVTVRADDWWHKMFNDNKLINRPEFVSYFGHDMVRGPFAHGNAADSFHVVLQKLPS